MKTKIKFNKKDLIAITNAFRSIKKDQVTDKVKELSKKLVPLAGWSVLSVNVDLTVDELLELHTVVSHFLTLGSDECLLAVINAMELKIKLQKTVYELIRG
jgi:hypothetical protein